MSKNTIGSPYFDEARGAWVLTRFRDVTAALREPALWPIAARGEDQSVTRDDVGRLKLRGPAQDALSADAVAEWEAQVEPLAGRILEALPQDRQVDLLAEFALPWCFEFALRVLNPRADLRERLWALGAEVFAATGAPDDSPLRPRAAAATAELDKLFAAGPMPMGEPTFIAISQTTPRLLANIWLALLEHPAETARLRAEPELWPGAIEELLRFGGIVRRIWRQAKGPVTIGDATLAGGDRAMLMLASANRDPEQFPDPDRLDVARRGVTHVALGAGRNFCVGGVVIRTAIAVSTRALLERFPAAQLRGTPELRAGSGYAFPASLPVVFT